MTVASAHKQPQAGGRTAFSRLSWSVLLALAILGLLLVMLFVPQVKALAAKLLAAASISSGRPLAFESGVFSLGDGPPGIKTDRKIYLKPTLPVLPRAGGKFFDPTFGTEIMRATDAADGAAPGLGTHYSHWPTFNSNNTRLLIRKGETGQAIIKSFDPIGFTIGKAAELPLALPGGGTPSWESATWSNNNPDIIYTYPNYWDGGLKLYAYNVATRRFAVIRDFSSLAQEKDYLKQMYVSADDDVFCWLHFRISNDESRAAYYLVYRRSTDKVLFHTANTYTGGLNEVHVDKSGQWLTIHVNQTQPDNSSTRFLNLQTGAIDFIYQNETDRPTGHGDLGTGTFVGFDNYQNGLHVRQLDDPRRFKLQFTFTDEQGRSDWTRDFHGTMYANDENWMTIGTFDDPDINLPDYHVFEDEIIQVALDGSGRFRRVCHTRSAIDAQARQTNTTGYWANPKPTISKDGRFIAFTSNWEKSGRYDLFIAKIEPAPRSAPDQKPPAPPTSPPIERPRRVTPKSS